MSHLQTSLNHRMGIPAGLEPVASSSYMMSLRNRPSCIYLTWPSHWMWSWFISANMLLMPAWLRTVFILVSNRESSTHCHRTEYYAHRLGTPVSGCSWSPWGFSRPSLPGGPWLLLLCRRIHFFFAFDFQGEVAGAGGAEICEVLDDLECKINNWDAWDVVQILTDDVCLPVSQAKLSIHGRSSWWVTEVPPQSEQSELLSLQRASCI